MKNNKIFILCMMFIFGLLVDEIITVYTCNNKGEFFTIFSGNYSCAKIEDKE